MKKYLFTLLLAFSILGGGSVLYTYAATPSATINNPIAPKITAENSRGVATITGTVNDAAVSLLNNTTNPGILYVKYGRKTGDPDKPYTEETSAAVQTKISSPSDVFTVSMKNLATGTYSYKLWIWVPSQEIRDGVFTQEAWYPLTGQYDFTIQAISEQIFARVQPTTTTETSATVSIDTYNVPAKLSNGAAVILGTITTDSSGAKMCNPDQTLKKAVIIDQSSDIPSKIEATFSSLSPQVYCVNLYIPAVKVAGTTVFDAQTINCSTEDQLQSEGNQTYAGFCDKDKGFFAVGKGVTVPDTLTSLSNRADRCGQTSTSTDYYCPLAPLPGTTDDKGGIDIKKQGIPGYISGLITLVIGLIGVLSVLMIVVGGIEYMSTVQVGEKEGARARITNAIFGLVLALGSYAVLNTINPNLVDLNVSLPNVTLQSEEGFTPTSGGGTYTGGGSNSNVTTNISTYDAYLKQAAASYQGVECTYLKAFMYAESGGDSNARSGAGARGLMQLMPDTFTGLGFDASKITDPQTNINAGAKYLQQLRGNACNGVSSNAVCRTTDMQFIITAYNGGPRANTPSKTYPSKTWWQCEQNGGYAETRNYVPKVQKNYDKLKANGWGC
jgi:hypothetical protein